MVIPSMGKRSQSGSLLDDAEPITVSAPPKKPDTKAASTYFLDDSSMNNLISLELAINLMHVTKESLGRSLVISSLTASYSL
jgi:hypothetical protein